MNKILSKYLLTFSLIVLVACGSGGSSSGVDPTMPGQNLPPIFVGVYTGTLNATIKGAGITDSDTFQITITVFADGTIRFDGDDPDETFTVGITDAGDFAGNLEAEDFNDDCTGTVGVTGNVDGTTATGTIEGDGECDVAGLDIGVEVTGTFTATKS